MLLYNKNSVNGYNDDDVSMLPLEKLNADMLDGIHLHGVLFNCLIMSLTFS